MADNWPFVAAAYGLATLVLGGYWRRLVRREREARSMVRKPPHSKHGLPCVAGVESVETTEAREDAERGR
jgi:hypothetical protein